MIYADNLRRGDIYLIELRKAVSMFKHVLRSILVLHSVGQNRLVLLLDGDAKMLAAKAQLCNGTFEKGPSVSNIFQYIHGGRPLES